MFWLIERVFSDHILYAFVSHQSELRLGELEVCKEKYMIREKRIQRIYRLCTALLAIIQTAIVLAEAIIQNEGERYFSPYLGILWNTVNIFFLVSLLIAYMYINIGLLVAMHRRHRLEFKEHIWW